MRGLSFHITNRTKKKINEAAKKAKDNTLEIIGSASLKATGAEGNTECSCLPVLQSHFLSIWL